MSEGELIYKTAGYSDDDKLTVDVGRAKCGEITDGIGFVHDRDGGWVLSFEDLEQIYLLNKSYRDRYPLRSADLVSERPQR